MRYLLFSRNLILNAKHQLNSSSSATILRNYKITNLQNSNKFHTIFRKNNLHQISPKAKNINIKYFKYTIGFTLSGLLLYDGIKNNFVYVGAAIRFLRSLKIALLISYDYMKYFNFHHSDANNTENDQLLKEIHLKSAKRILDGCLRNGGLYIKIGQGVAAINHILPSEYTTVLSQLYDKCLLSKKDDIIKLFKEDFNKTPDELYDEFNYEPIAAASLAQVFKAKLKSGQDVAVKVQYLDLQKRFPSDLGTIMFLQDLVEIFFKNYNFSWILKDIRKNLEQEMNFINEAKNAERCANDLQKFKFIIVPKVYWDLTKMRVLTMEWIDGYKITDKEKLIANKIELKEVDKKLFKAFSEQIFSSGFVHADPHPGNILVRKNRKNGQIELVLLDHGLYEYIPENIREPLCKFWEATVLRNENEMQKCANELQINNYKNFAEVLFQTPFDVQGIKLKTRLTDEDIKYMQNIAKNHFELIMDTLKEMPRNMLFIIRNLNTIRAISREHGDPIDRPKLMARYAQKCLYKNKSFSYFRWIIRRIIFEYYLWKESFKLSVISMYMNVLYKLSRSPEKIQFQLNQNFK